MTEPIGKQLKQAREASKLTLEDVSKATHMKLHYLQALEDGDYEAIPSATQARGFLRAYSNYLGLDPDRILAELDGETSVTIEEEPATPIEKPGKTAPDPDLDEETAETIFIEVGERLKNQRETLGLSLDDVEHHTNLRRHYLVALEAGDMESMPSPVQARGMLNNYAVFLGMDPGPVMIRFAEGLQTGLSSKQTTGAKPRKKSTRRKTVPHPMRRFLSNDFLVGGALIIFLAIFIVWGGIRIFAMQSEEAPDPTAPSIADVLLASPSPTVTRMAVTETALETNVAAVNPEGNPDVEETVEAPLIIGDSEGIEIYITVHQRVWLKVTVDEEVALQQRVLPGSAYSYSGENTIEILTGNGLAIQVFYNGEDLKRMGEYGEVVLWIFSKEGPITPTPTITLTPTITPRTTPTAPLPGAGTSVPPAP